MKIDFWFSTCQVCGNIVWRPLGIFCVECDKWYHSKCFFEGHERAGFDTELVK